MGDPDEILVSGYEMGWDGMGWRDFVRTPPLACSFSYTEQVTVARRTGV